MPVTAAVHWFWGPSVALDFVAEANSASLYGYSGNTRTPSPTAHGARLSIHPLMLGKDHRRAPGGCAGMDQALASE